MNEPWQPRICLAAFTIITNSMWTKLELAIELYVAHHNIDPKPFIWTASATDVLAKVTRAKAAIAASAG